MTSIEGETVPFSSPVEITDSVEGWMADLTRAMVQTLRDSLVACCRYVLFACLNYCLPSTTVCPQLV